MRAITRDPFARQTLVRATVRPLAHGESCAWCGGIRTSRRFRSASLYRYGTERVALHPRVPWHDGLFCSKSCHDAYHE